MCGRYTLTATPAAVAEHFGLETLPDVEARYNVAPGQPVPVVRAAVDGSRRLERRRWGLVPGWAADPGIRARLINARRETVATKPAFRDAFRRRRCLVPADGFFEWSAQRGARQPHHIHLPDAGVFAFAGLYERWRPGEPGEALDTCTILTAAANDRVRGLHDRMPVILAPDAYAGWLDPGLEDAAELERLLDSAAGPCGELVHRPVALRVNDARRDAPDCLDDPEPPPQAELF